MPSGLWTQVAPSDLGNRSHPPFFFTFAMNLWNLGALMQILPALAFESHSPGTLSIPIKGIRDGLDPLPRLNHLSRRADLPELALMNQLTFYQATLKFGSKSETLKFTIDTGSSDLWVMSEDNPYCAQNDQQVIRENRPNCSAPITFDYSASDTFSKNESSTYSAQYADGSSAEGFYAQDTVVVGGATVKNANFAVATSTNVTQPVFGIASVNNEATRSLDRPYTYSNIPVQLKEQGFTQAVAYSLWLNDLNSLEGSILFGGLDHKKYVGDLQLVPMVTFSSDGQQINPPVLPFVMLHEISVYNKQNMASTIVEASFPVALDSGTSLAYLPTDVIDAIGQTIGATPLQDLNIYGAYCDLSGGLIWNFSGVEIYTAFSQLLYPLVTNSGQPATYQGRAICGLNIMPSENLFLLGDLFLRSAYVVFDFENYQVALANTNFNSTDSDISTISGSVSASTAPNYSSTDYLTDVTTRVATTFTSSISPPSETNGAAASGRQQDGITTGQSVASGNTMTASKTKSAGSGSSSASSSSSSSSKSKNAGHMYGPSSFFAVLAAGIWSIL